MINNNKVLVIDLETTNLSNKYGHIIEVGITD